MTHPTPGFRPGVEPEIVHMQHSVAAPRVVVVSLDTLELMHTMLAYETWPSVRKVNAQIKKIIEDAYE